MSCRRAVDNTLPRHAFIAVGFLTGAWHVIVVLIDLAYAQGSCRHTCTRVSQKGTPLGVLAGKQI